MRSYSTLWRLFSKPHWRFRTSLCVAGAGVLAAVTAFLCLQLINESLDHPYNVMQQQALRHEAIDLMPDVAHSFPLAQLDKVKALEGVEAVIPTTALIREFAHNDKSASIVMVASDCSIGKLVGKFDFQLLELGESGGPAGPLASSATPTAANPPAGDIPTVMSRPAARLLGAEPGDVIHMPGTSRPIRVVAVAKGTSEFLRNEAVMFFSFDGEQKLLNRPPVASAVYVLALPGDVKAVTPRLNRALTGVAKAHSPADRIYPQSEAHRLAAAGASYLVLLCAMALASLVYLAAMESRYREIATYQLLNGRTRSFMIYMFLESIAVAAVVAIVAVPLSLGLAHLLGSLAGPGLSGNPSRIGRLPFDWSWFFFQSLVISVGIALLSALVCVLRSVIPHLCNPSGSRLMRRRRLLGSVLAALLVAFGVWRIGVYGRQGGSVYGLVLPVTTLLVGTCVAGYHVCHYLLKCLRTMSGDLNRAGASGRVAYSSLRSGSVRVAVIVAIISLGVGLVGGFLSWGDLAERSVVAAQRSLADDVLSVQPYRAAVTVTNCLNPEVVEKLKLLPGVAKVVPQTHTIVFLGEQRVSVAGVDPDFPSGRWTSQLPEADARLWHKVKEGEVIVGPVLASRLGLKANDTITIPTTSGGKAFKIAEVRYPPLNAAWQGHIIVMSHDQAATIKKLAARFSYVVLHPGESDQAFRDAMRASPELAHLKIEKPLTLAAAARQVLTTYTQPLVVIGSVVIVFGVFLVLTYLVISMRRIQGKRSMLRISGSFTQLDRQILLQTALVVGVSSGILGGSVTLLVSWVMTQLARPHFGVVIPWHIIWSRVVWSFAGALLITLFACLIASAKVWRVGENWPESD